MKLIILGSGTCIPDKDRGSSGYALIMKKSRILLDCGNGSTWKLEKLGIDFFDIDHIFITHIHPDHTSDLIPFLFARKNPLKNIKQKKLCIWGPRGFNEFFSYLKNAYKDWIVPESLEINELDEEQVIFDDFRLHTINTLHTENSVAFKVISEDKSIIYTGDTDYSPELVTFSKNCNLLLIECSFPDKQKTKGHLTPSDILKFYEIALPKKVVLTHIYPVLKDKDFKMIKDKLQKKLIIAEDLMQIEI